MLNRIRLSRLVVNAFWGLTMSVVVSAAWADESNYVKPGLLVEAEDLAKLLDNPRVVVLDARSESAFEEKRISGARWVNHADWAKSFQDGEGQHGDAWQAKVRALGIHNDSRVVVYDDAAMKDSARIWWILRFFGADRVQVLNGGWRGWQESSYPVAEGPTEATFAAGNFEVNPNADKLTRQDDLLSSLSASTFQVVDSRSFDEHCGVNLLSNERGGAIPGAKHLEWSDLVDSETHRFRSASELKQIFTQAGIDLARPTATHCQSGGRASVMVLGLELMGAEDVRNYYRGWSEWGSSDSTPIQLPGEKSKP
jgi:thiosulfate/3-mercaptopyruvate sulfurtransferase